MYRGVGECEFGRELREGWEDRLERRNLSVVAEKEGSIFCGCCVSSWLASLVKFERVLTAASTAMS